MYSAPHRRTPILGPRTAWGVSLSTLLLLTPATSWADEISPEDVRAFQAKVEESGALLREHQYGAAVEKLEQARAIVDHPRISLRLAQAYAEWQRCEQATLEYEQLTTRGDVDEDTLETIDEELQSLEQCVQHVHLSLRCSPPTAEVQAHGPDGRITGVDCSFSEDRPVGEYRFRFSAPDHENLEHNRTLTGTDDVVIEVELQPAPSYAEVEPPPETARWPKVLSFGAMAAGVGLIAGGGIVDYRAGQRASQLADARDAGDIDQVRSLQSSASSARYANIALYGIGATFLLGGIAMMAWDFDAPSSDETASLSVELGLSPGGISTLVRW